MLKSSPQIVHVLINVWGSYFQNQVIISIKNYSAIERFIQKLMLLLALYSDL